MNHPINPPAIVAQAEDLNKLAAGIAADFRGCERAIIADFRGAKKINLVLLPTPK
jgi:hypothetical protein